MKLRFMLLISLALVLLTAISCSEADSDDNIKNSDTITSVTDESTEQLPQEDLYPDLPEEDYDGYEFTVLHYEDTLGARENMIAILSEGENGDTINDAVFKRNLAIEEKYNIKFSLQTYFNNYGDVNQAVIRSVNSGDDIYDVVYQRMYNVPSLISGGYLIDLNTVPYIDFDMPWWDSNSINNTSIAGKVFLAATDINIIDKNATYVILFSKTHAENYNLPDMYQIIDTGQWTMDKLLELSSNISIDLNGDDKMDKNDFFGILGRHDAMASLFRGAGCLIAEKDSNDLPVLAFNSEYNYTVIDKILDVMYSDDFVNLHTRGISEPEFSSMVANDQGLFAFTMLAEVSILRTSEFDFGILPIPKYSEANENYHNLVSVHWTGLLSIPTTNNDLNRTGVILEAWAAESHYTLQPAYYDINLIGKAIRDVESERMLDLIFNNRLYDTGDIFNFSDFSYQFLLFAATDSRDVASFYAKYEEKVQTEIDKLINVIIEME